MARKMTDSELLSMLKSSASPRKTTADNSIPKARKMTDSELLGMLKSEKEKKKLQNAFSAAKPALEKERRAQFLPKIEVPSYSVSSPEDKPSYYEMLDEEEKKLLESKPKIPVARTSTIPERFTQPIIAKAPSSMSTAELERALKSVQAGLSTPSTTVRLSDLEHQRDTLKRDEIGAESDALKKIEAEIDDIKNKRGRLSADLSYLGGEYEKRIADSVKNMTDEELDAIIESDGAVNPFKYVFSSKADKLIADTKSQAPKAEKYQREVVDIYNALPEELRGALDETVYLTAKAMSGKAKERDIEHEKQVYADLQAGIKAAGISDEQYQQLWAYSTQKANAKLAGEMSEDIKNKGTPGLIGANIASIPNNLTSGVGQLDITAQTLRNRYSKDYRPVDYNTPATEGGRYAREVRKETSERLEDHPVANFIYNTTMSIADSATAVAVAGHLAPVLLSGSAGLNAIYDAKERGASDIQAVNMGISAAVAEAIFEKVSIEAFLKPGAVRTVKDGAINFFKQMFTEGSEEFFTSVANEWADRIVMGDKSEFNTNVREYIEKGGLSREEAQKKAMTDYIVSLGLDFLGGAVSGGVFGTTGNIRNWKATKESDRIEAQKKKIEEYETAGMTDAERKLHLEARAAGVKAAEGASESINKNTPEISEVTVNNEMYALKGKNEQGIEVYETSDEVKQLSQKQKRNKFLGLMKKQYRGRTAKFSINGKVYYARFTADDVRKNIYGDDQSSVKGEKAKLNVGADGDIFELVENAKYERSGSEQGKTNKAHKNIQQWDYFVKTVQIDNVVYDVLVNVRKNDNNEYVYNVALNENKKVSAAPSHSPTKGALEPVSGNADRMLTADTDNSIAENVPVVNSQSMQKSENNSEDSAELEKIALQNRKREATLKAYNDERARIIENNLVELGEGEDSAKHGGKLLVSALNGTLDSEGARTIAGNKNLLVTFNALVGSELDSGDVDTLSDEILNAVDARLELMQKSRIESRELQNEASLGRAGKAYLEQLKVPGYYTNDFVHYYTAGLLGESISKANESLDSPMPHIMKVYALKAGRLDRTEYRNASGAKSKIITKAGFIENEYSSHLSAAEKNELGAIARALGYNIGYMAPTGEGGDDAKVDRDNGIIWIARDNESPVRTLIVHELTHVFATRDPAAFEKYVRIAVADMQRHRTFDSKINDMLDRYEAAEHYIDRMAALEEIGAYYTGELLERTDLYSAILNKNRSLGTRLRDALANVINRIKSAFGKGGSLDNYGVSLAQSQRALTAWTRMLEQTKSDVAKANKREEKAERKKEKDGQGLNSDGGILDFTDESEDASIDEGIEQELMAIAAEDDVQESAPADEKHSLKKVDISKDDVITLRSIGRKSVNDFTSKDIKKAEPFARRAWQELGIKSPFFRAWFGDWRVNDDTPIVKVTDKSDTRGLHQNEDTDWKINRSAKVSWERHSSNSSIIGYSYMPYIDNIIKYSILLNSEVSDNENENSLMFHSMYSVVDADGKCEVIKLTVEELKNPGRDVERRAYKLTSIQILPAVVQKGSPKLTSSLTAGSISSISDLFDFVKTYDKEFNPKPASKIVDEDGMPMVLYHGTDSEFTSFDMSKGRANMDIQGAFFSPWELDAQGYGSNVKKYYLSLKNPADGGTAFAALNRFKGQNDAGVKAREYLIKQGFDGVDFYGEEYVAFYPEQIKSATDNIGTFDKADSDTRYSVKKTKSDAPIELHEIANMASQMAGVDELGSINNAAVKEISELLKIPVSSIERLRELHREYRKNTSDQKALSTFCDACFRLARTTAAKEFGFKPGTYTHALDKYVSSLTMDITKLVSGAEYRHGTVTKVRERRKLKDGSYDTKRDKYILEGLTVNNKELGLEVRESLADGLFFPKSTLERNRLGVREAQDAIEKFVNGSAEEKREAYRRISELEAENMALSDENIALVEFVDRHTRERLFKVAKRLLNGKKISDTIKQRAREEFKKLGITELSLNRIELDEHDKSELNVLSDVYKLLQKEDPEYEDEHVKRITDELAKQHIDELTPTQTSELLTALIALEHEYKHRNKLLGIKETKELARIAGEEIRTIGNAPMIDTSTAWNRGRNKYVGLFMTPENIILRSVGFDRNSHLYACYKALDEGQKNMLRYINEADDFFAEFLKNDKFVKSLAKRKVTYSHKSGAKLELTPNQVIALILNLRCADNEARIRRRGISIQSYDEYVRGKNEWQHSRRVKLSGKQISELEALLTKDELAYLNKIDEYFGVMNKDAINRTSKIILGYEKAGIQNYYPIITDQNYVAKDYVLISPNGLPSHEFANLKERQEDARSPLVLYGATEVLERSIKNTARYSGLAIPMMDFKKVYNSKTLTYDFAKIEEMKKKIGFNKIKSASVRRTMETSLKRNYVKDIGSVRDMLDRRFGKSANEQIQTFLRDLGAIGHDYDALGIISKLRGNYARAKLHSNLNTVLVQLSGVMSAGATLGVSNVSAAYFQSAHFDEKKLKLIEKYTPLLRNRMRGFTYQELGSITSEIGKSRVGSKIDSILSNPKLDWLTRIDIWTAKKVWCAAEIKVARARPNLKKENADAYYKQVAREFDEAMQKTQPNSTVLQRPFVMRHKGAWDLLTMFKSQAYATLNVTYEAWAEYRTALKRKEYIKADERSVYMRSHRKKLWNAFGSLILMSAITSVMRTVSNAIRLKLKDYLDDDDELSAEELAYKLIGDAVLSIIEPFPILGNILNTAYSGIKYGQFSYSSTFTETHSSVANDFISAIFKFGNTIYKDANGKDVDILDYADALWNIGKIIAEGAIGVPISNIEGHLKSIEKWIALVSGNIEKALK